MGIFIVHYLWLFFCFTISYAQIAQTPLLSPFPSPFKLKESPFRPSIAVVVGLLTTIFSITFLLLLYAKHCKRGPFETTPSGGGFPPPSSFRRNSGIDRTVIESLPVFRFGSLVGQKAEGLECAVCLNKFEPSEILRLLPKCKHAFHVECVDTWLDAHSTCPLCRYQIHPEDILLENGPPLLERKYNDNIPSKIPHIRSWEGGLLERKSFSNSAASPVKAKEKVYSSAGRHSSAGERGTSSLQIIVETPNEKDTETTSFLNTRMSLDSWNFYRKKIKRKDGLLLSAPGKSDVAAEEPQQQRRLEHRVIISEATSGSGTQYRWSDVEASDMLFLRSEMIISETRRYRKWTGKMEDHGSGKGVINERSVSEMTGVSRFRSNEDEQERQRQRKGAVTRWLAWMSQSQSEIAAVPAAAAAASTSAT